MTKQKKKERKFPPICLMGAHDMPTKYSVLSCEAEDCYPWIAFTAANKEPQPEELAEEVSPSSYSEPTLTGIIS